LTKKVETKFNNRIVPPQCPCLIRLLAVSYVQKRKRTVNN